MPLDQFFGESSEFRLTPLDYGLGPTPLQTLTELSKNDNLLAWMELRKEKTVELPAGLDDVTLTYASRFLVARSPEAKLYVFEPLEIQQWFTYSTSEVVFSIRRKLEFYDGNRIIVMLGRNQHWALVDYVRGSDGGEATYVDGISELLLSEAEKVGLWLHLPTGSGPFSFTKASVFCQEGGTYCGAVSLLHLGWRLNLWEDFTKLDVLQWHCALRGGEFPRIFGCGESSDRPDALREWMRPFLLDKGVSESSVDQRIDRAIRLFGRSKLETTVKSNNPWQGLKALGSSLPKPFLWLTYLELQEQIKKKGETKWGADLDVAKKSRKKSRAPPIPIDKILDPSQIVIPDGHFTDGDTDLPQIRVEDIRSGARGVAILQLDDALPFLKDGKSISEECLMLLIVGKHDINGHGPLSFRYITLPAHYAGTGEPVLVPCTCVQLGDGMIQEVVDDDCPEVDTLPTAVVRFHIYKDEWVGSWDDLVRRPLKGLTDHVPLLQLCRQPKCQQDCGRSHLTVEEHGADSILLDVWGWKWSSLEGRKTRPQEAMLLQVYFRCPESVEAPIQEASGIVGAYFEPRQSEGTGPSQNFSVIWLLELIFGMFNIWPRPMT